jgi:cobyric acid synthase
MKSCIRIALLASLICFFITPSDSFAQDMNRALEKEYKDKLKEYKKEGWIIDSDRSAEVVLMKHYSKLNANEDLITIKGTATNCRSTNVCKQVALNNAQNEYARLVSGKIEGAFASIIRTNSSCSPEEIDKMYGILINEVKADVSGVLQPSYSIYREKKGVKEYQTIFIVNNNDLIDNMEKALEQSIKETKITIEEVRSISKFVGEELKKELGVSGE